MSGISRSTGDSRGSGTRPNYLREDERAGDTVIRRGTKIEHWFCHCRSVVEGHKDGRSRDAVRALRRL